MKHINEVFEDKEHSRLVKAKKESGCRSWREFFLMLIDRLQNK